MQKPSRFLDLHRHIKMQKKIRYFEPFVNVHRILYVAFAKITFVLMIRIILYKIVTVNPNSDDNGEMDTKFKKFK